ncbi:hypothetical protein [Spiroplasma poulsonii]|uniref:hypothetical protein n=1 Tax=Spiroplasma poulsonii TaxID=2138 RepID=UPI001F4C7C79|nr:hypothetical protein [Spiroplasma poulsonii]UNF62419.1 hypothetical protein MNU24_02840 [Spiroplasma poulsonii]
MIKIGIDTSGTGTTGIVVYEDNKIIEKFEFTNKDWIKQIDFIRDILCDIWKYNNYILNIEDCLYTSANASKDRDDLLRLLGVIEDINQRLRLLINWLSPKYTKSTVKNIENLSKYNNNNNNNCIQKFSKDNNLTYEYGKGWKYKNEKISHHIRDAIIIVNYES